MICRKCRNSFKRWTSVDGKLRNLSHRRYCLACSPFGEHNTKVLDSSVKQDRQGLPKKYTTSFWAGLQIFYDDGHSLRDAKSEFKIAWKTLYAACNNGLLKTRNHATAVALAGAQGKYSNRIWTLTALSSGHSTAC